MPATKPPLGIEDAATLIRRGGVVAYPTEAVYGLGCDPGDAQAVERVLAIKTRPEDKGLILIASTLQQLQAWIAPLSAAQRATIESTWPGHTTWVVPANANCPAILTGGRDTVAVRVSAHPVVRALCDAIDGALVSTSANRSGEPAIRETAALHGLTGVDAIVDGPLGKAEKPSAIFRLSDGAKLR